MVSFSCDGCGEILKKSQVDTHANRCRNCFAVSCVDCNVSFPGDDYRKHTSCMTEAEKYQKTDYKGNASNNNKKQIKLSPQQAWNNIIELSMNTAPKHLQEYIRTISSCDNVPRKEKQFINFIKNSLRGCNPTTIQHIWDHLQLTRTEQQQQQQQQAQQTQQTQPATAKVSVDQSTTSTITPTKIKNSKSDVNIVDDVDDDNDEQDNGTNNTKKESQSVPPTGSDEDDDVNEDNEDTKMDESSSKKLPIEEKASTTKSSSSSKVTNKNLPKSKVVIKVMKNILKNTKNNKMPTKELRKTVARQLQQQQHQLDKNQIRQLIREVTQSDSDGKKRFTIQGKIISLRT